MDDLRIRIWDYLYRLGHAEQIAVIAEHMEESPQTIQQIVNDPWFSIDEQNRSVAIAKTD